MADEKPKYPVNPDGRYFVVRGRFWRRADPSLTADARADLVKTLMAARRAVGAAKRNEDAEGIQQARALVDKVKRRCQNRTVVKPAERPLWEKQTAKADSRQPTPKLTVCANPLTPH